jgi:hypothetical protein
MFMDTIKLGMRLLPFQTLRRLLDRAADRPIRNRPKRPWRADHLSAERVAWAVEVASRHTPGIKTCLAQALAAQVLLARRGPRTAPDLPYPHRCGAGQDDHAWVESQSKVIIGGSVLEQYTPLPVPEGERSYTQCASDRYACCVVTITPYILGSESWKAID